MKPSSNDPMYFYESFADQFDAKMNRYDTTKRVRIIYDELLHESLAGTRLLDVGCGTGWFSQAAEMRGARVVALDLGERLLQEVAKKCRAAGIVGSLLELPFLDNTFDIVVSSEVLEHVPNSLQAIGELYRVLKPGGTVVVTTPNRLWHFAIWIANTLRLRPYRGLENWLGWSELKDALENTGFIIEEMKGFHVVPFVFPVLYPALNFFDRFGHTLGPLMLNMAVRCRKRSPPSPPPEVRRGI